MDILRGVRKSRRKSRRGKRRNYGFDYKLRAVKLHLEEGVPVALVCEETGMPRGTMGRWIKSYRDRGEEGLKSDRHFRGTEEKLPAAVKDKIIEVKKENPGFGVRRISQILRRIFFLPGSPETVRRTLQKESLLGPLIRKQQRNPGKPRFFERATPNQMWQSDIFTFRLGGRYAYLIGYIDDYSRYMTGLDLFRSQTGEHVIEIYRRAVGESGPPQEMLTDNGRQYVNWRGESRFQQELKKDRVKHIRSSPHHPMTLGKIERFWKTIFQEFLARAQFLSFEEAEERVRWWVRYYNHKRPHQGIGGLCPADRYFEIQSEMKKTIEQGIQENVLEMALRGKPKSPFYMVGRMDGQSVVLRAEKGRLKLTVDGEDGQEAKELVYDLEKSAAQEESVPSGTEGLAQEGGGFDPGGEEGEGPEASGSDLGGAERPDHGGGGGDSAGGVAEDVLQVGGAGAGGDGAGAHGRGVRPPREAGGSGEGGTQTAGERVGEGG